MKLPDKLTRKLIESYIKRFKENEQLDEAVVREVFSTFKNDSLEHIMIKVVVLNNRYSAGLNDNISDKELDKRGNLIAMDVINMSAFISHEQSIVRHTVNEAIELANTLGEKTQIEVNGRQLNRKKSYSFASKYVFWENYIDSNEKLQIPIYDSRNITMLHKISANKDNGLRTAVPKDFATYKEYADCFLKINKEINKKLKTNFSTRDFDMFFWQYAKDHNM